VKEAPKKIKLKENIDVNTVEISRDHYFPNAYVIDLPLEFVPDHAWQDILDREWKTSLRLWDRKLFVVGDRLRLVTTIDDIEGKLDWVKQVVERTNKGIDEYNRDVRGREALTEEETHKRTSEENVGIDTIRDSLKKTFRTF
jgi:tRNA uridine 5-carbamoylmethylation protein Kti12